MNSRPTAPACHEWPRMPAASLMVDATSVGNPEPLLARPARPPAASPITGSPTAPAALALLLRQEDLELDLVTGLVAPDTTLANQVLRLANSVTFNRGVPVHSLSEAVARLGFGQLRKLIAHSDGTTDTPA